MDSIEQLLIDAVTYNGSVNHCLINYTLIGLTVLPHLVARGQSRENKYNWLWVLISATFIQALLWFLFNSVGVSVIWCAITGFNIFCFKVGRPYLTNATKAFYVLGFIMTLAGTLYYLVALPPITTIAHVMAISVGIGLFYLYKNRDDERKF